MVLHLSFCSDLEIHHFFCEIKQLVQLACYDTFLNNTELCFGAVIMGGGPLTGILYSYSKIVSSICGISSAHGKYKAFSTCVSHLSIVSLFYFSGLVVYLSSAATHSSHSSATGSVMYTVVTPMLNPFTLWNISFTEYVHTHFTGYISMSGLLRHKVYIWRRTQQPTPVFLHGESMDRGALQARVHRVTQSRIWLKWLSMNAYALIFQNGCTNCLSLQHCKRDFISHSSDFISICHSLVLYLNLLRMKVVNRSGICWAPLKP